ncbi:MAG TPA: glycosyltransferase family A protein [Streptosporangiaceae bacterium]
MDDRPLVSIIIPNYNYGSVLGRCLEAAVTQTYENVEVVLVDDCSTDDSLAVAARYPCTVVSHTVNGGEAVTRNTGAAHSRGDVLFFVDSDVALRPDAVEKAMAVFRADPAVGCVYGIYEKDPLNRAGVVKEYRTLQTHYWRISSLGEADVGFTSLAAIRRSVWDEVGPFKPVRVGEEMDWGARVAKATRAVLTDEVRGFHDDEEKLSRLLRKLYERAKIRIPFGFDQGKFAHADETGNRIVATMCAALAVASIPAAVLWPALWAVTAVLLCAFVLLDKGMYAFVWRDRRSASFLASYVVLHLICSVVVVAGGVVGFAQWLVSPRYRRLFAPPPEPVRAPSPDAALK